MFSFRKSLSNIIGGKQGPHVEQKSIATSNPDLLELFGGTTTRSGISVSGSNALSIPAVLQAVRLISENIGSLPCKLYHDLEQGKKQAKEHTAFRIVHSRANSWTSAGQLRTDLTRDALIYGSGFARVVRFNDGRPFELHYLAPSAVSVLEDDQTGEPVYRVAEQRGTVDYPFTEILHIRAFAGQSPVSFGREAIGLAGILEKHAADLFKGGARPPAVISRDKAIPSDQAMGETTVKRIRDRFRAAATNGFNVPLILDDGWDYDQMALASTDAQFLENRVFQIDEIARVFGVPPTMLFELTRGTWSNAEEMSRSFLQLCLRPWLDRWQDAFATVLLTEDEQDNYTFEFVIDDLQRADTATRAEVFSKLVSARVMSPNEVRSAMNLPPLPGGDELVNPFTTSTAAPVQSLDTRPVNDTSKDISND